MKDINLYYHGGSMNHGCEAIVRATTKILNQDITLYSFDKKQDEYYGLDKIVTLREDIPQEVKRFSLAHILSVVSAKIDKSDYAFVCKTHRSFFEQVEKGSVYLSVGGDNYCYDGREILGFYNKMLHNKGAKTVLWGCSFEPDDISKAGIKNDLAAYDMIIARESLSYNVLKSVNQKTFLLPDPAFQLEKVELPLPDGFLENKTVGINLSPLISSYGDDRLIFNNYKNLLQHILDETEYSIALIPHVVLPHNDDRSILKKLYDLFAYSNRVIFIDDCNCMQLKGYISRCRMFIGARTHATIAAYSTCVPTIVTGYSVKARGIATDLFGTDKNYVQPVQNLRTENDLKNAFTWLCKNESSIRLHLNDFIPEYKQQIYQANERIKSV